ncbi:MAG: hypothetical protein AB8G05_25725 [Oligoflexales bacterium]
MDIAELNSLKGKLIVLLEQLKAKDNKVNFNDDMKPLLNLFWNGLDELTTETNNTINQLDSLESEDAEIILEELKNLREFASTVNEMIQRYR